MSQLRLDPTRTVMLRRRLLSDVRIRFALIKQVRPTEAATIQRIVGDYSGYWSQYTERAFRKGVERSWGDAKRQLDRQEFDILRRDFLRKMESEIQSQGNLLSSRLQSELQNVAQGTLTKIRRAIADARAQSLPARETERLVRRAIDRGHREAERAARTELTRAYTEGQLAALKEVGVDRVTVMVEWVTSGLGETELGNPSPCTVCEPLEGIVFTLEEAVGLLPRHPNCLCSYMPVLNPTNLGTKRRVERAVQKSLSQERPKLTKRTVARQSRVSSWPGGRRKLQKRSAIGR